MVFRVEASILWGRWWRRQGCGARGERFGEHIGERLGECFGEHESEHEYEHRHGHDWRCGAFYYRGV